MRRSLLDGRCVEPFWNFFLFFQFDPYPLWISRRSLGWRDSQGRMAAPQPLEDERSMTMMAHTETGDPAVDRRGPEHGEDRAQESAGCGGDAYPHQFVTEQAGAALSRIVCSMCGTVRIEQRLDRSLVLTWSRTDYEIADRFYRELVS
jgi:hypothetical protein